MGKGKQQHAGGARPKSHEPQNGQKDRPKKARAPRKQSTRARMEKDETVAVAQNRTTKSGRAKITSDASGVTFEHSEKFFDVVDTATFTTNGFFINPGNAALFPWLSDQATGFQEFIIEYLEVIFISKASSNTTGSVMLGCDYDVSSPLPLTDTAMDAYIGTVELSPWKNASWKADFKSMKALSMQKYILQGYAVNDLKTYCPGNFILATQDGPGTAAKWGKLWVKYKIRLLTPQLSPAVGPATSVIGGTVFGGGTMSATDCLGTAPTLDPQAQGISLVQRLGSSTAFAIQLPGAGSFMLVVILTGTTLASSNVGGYVGGVSAVNIGTFVTSGSLTLCSVFYINAPASTNPANGQFWILSTGAATITAANFRIAPVPNNSITFKKMLEPSGEYLKKYLAAKEAEEAEIKRLGVTTSG